MAFIAQLTKSGSTLPDGVTVEKVGPDSFPTFYVMPFGSGMAALIVKVEWDDSLDYPLLADALRMIADELDTSDE
jgi:hypothetical protein